MNKAAAKTLGCDSQQNSEKLDCPEGWVTTRIDEVVELNPPKPPKDALPPETPVTFVPMPAVDAYDGKITAADERPFGAVRKGYTAFHKDDVIFAKITPCMENGKSAVVPTLTNGLGFGSTEFHVLRPTGAVIPEYLYYYLRQNSFRRAAEAEMTGSVGQKRVPAHFLKNALLPLAPLAEQKRIVAKLEELLTRVNIVRGRLARVKEILKHFRHSVLAAACSGRLTEDWRSKNRNNGTIQEILHEIKRKRFEKAKTPTQKKKLEYIYSYEEAEDRDSLPDTWRYVSLDKLCYSFQYGTSRKSQPIGKVAVLRMGNIQNGAIDWNDLVYTSDDGEIQKYGLKPGDVLFNRTNSPELVGKTGIYKGEQPAVFAGYLIRISNFEELEPNYLNYCLSTQYARKFCLRVKSDAVSQSNINAQKLAKFEVPFCSPEEQKEIVRRAEALFKIADAIDGRFAATMVKTEKLVDVILAKTFSGELVPTEAELARREGRPFESASVLLERIGKAREEFRLSTKKTKRRGRRRSRAQESSQPRLEG